MSLRLFITGMVFITLISLGSFVVILFNIDPHTADFFSLALFYFSLFIFGMGFFTLFGIWLRKLLSKKELGFAQVVKSFRQGTLLAVILIGAFILQSFRILNWGTGLLIVILVMGLEIYLNIRH